VETVRLGFDVATLGPLLSGARQSGISQTKGSASETPNGRGAGDRWYDRVRRPGIEALTGRRSERCVKLAHWSRGMTASSISSAKFGKKRNGLNKR
jgi:hypothetical protein